MKPTTEPGLSRLMLSMLGLALVGGALVAFLWETLNQLLAGHVDGVRVLVSLPVLAVFLLLLRFLARRVEGWHDEPAH